MPFMRFGVSPLIYCPFFYVYSFWGKFGQRLNQGVCEYIHDSQLDKFYTLLTDRTKKVKDFHIINEDHLHLEYEH